MPDQNQTQTTSLAPVHYYDVIYEDLVQDLACLMRRDQREHWTPMLTVDADETINQPKLDYLKEHIAALEDEYWELNQTSTELTSTGKRWMTDAAKHPSDVRGTQRTRYKQLRDDHDVATLERKVKDKLAAFRNEISRQKAVYHAAESVLSQNGFNSGFNDSSESHRGTDEFDMTGAYLGLHGLVRPTRNSHAILQDPRNGEFSDSTNAASVQYDQDDVVADAILLEPNGKVVGSFDAAADQYRRPNPAADVNLQSPYTESNTIKGSDQERTNAFSGACYASEYAVSVKQLSTMLCELEEDVRDSPSIDRSEDSKLEMKQVIQVLRQANDWVSATATKWMGDAAASGRYRTEMEILQTARKKLNVVSLQRHASAILQELRKACRKDDYTSRESAQDNPLRADDCESTFTEFSRRSMPDDTRDPFATPDEYNRQTSNSHSTKLTTGYENLSEPFSGYEEEDIAPDQNIEGSEGFDSDTKDTQAKNISAYAILSNKENDTTRHTTLLECVKVTVGHPAGKTQQCETVLLFDSASDHP